MQAELNSLGYVKQLYTFGLRKENTWLLWNPYCECTELFQLMSQSDWLSYFTLYLT